MIAIGYLFEETIENGKDDKKRKTVDFMIRTITPAATIALGGALYGIGKGLPPSEAFRRYGVAAGAGGLAGSVLAYHKISQKKKKKYGDTK